MTTGERIREARKKAGMTQAELATILGIPYQSIGQWERGMRNPKYETLERLANILDVSVAYLQGLELYTPQQIADALAIGDFDTAEKMAGLEPGTLHLLPQNLAEDIRLTRLAANYNDLNDHSRQRLVEYSDDLVSNPQNRREADNPEE